MQSLLFTTAANTLHVPPVTNDFEGIVAAAFATVEKNIKSGTALNLLVGYDAGSKLAYICNLGLKPSDNLIADKWKDMCDTEATTWFMIRYGDFKIDHKAIILSRVPNVTVTLCHEGEDGQPVTHAFMVAVRGEQLTMLPVTLLDIDEEGPTFGISYGDQRH